jgi:hypothetical protein
MIAIEHANQWSDSNKIHQSCQLPDFIADRSFLIIHRRPYSDMSASDSTMMT